MPDAQSAAQSAAKPREMPPLLRLSDAAAARLRQLYDGGKAGMLLRVSVGTKGCSGLSYDMGWVDRAGPGDERVTDHGLTVLIDRKATLFLTGTTMDYQVRAMSSGFTFVNPNEKGRCGCGESFHV